MSKRSRFRGAENVRDHNGERHQRFLRLRSTSSSLKISGAGVEHDRVDILREARLSLKSRSDAADHGRAQTLASHPAHQIGERFAQVSMGFGSLTITHVES